MFTDKLKHGHDHLERACVRILEYCNSNSSTTTWKLRIIVASFHNPNRATRDETRIQNAEHFFEALNHLWEITGYPVVVGGDFNCELLNPKGKVKKVDTCGFEVQKYNPTIHRALIGSSSSPCIDFFAYKNYSSGCIKIEVKNVHANMLPLPGSAALIKGTGGQHSLDYKECKYITDKYHPGLTLTAINNKSNHDPLRATLLVKFKLPMLTISYYDVNNDQNTLDNLCITYTTDVVILCNCTNQEYKESRISSLEGYKPTPIMSNSRSTMLLCKEMKLNFRSGPVPFTHNHLKYFYLELVHQEKDDLNIIFIYATETDDDDDVENVQNFKEKLDQLFFFIITFTS